TPRFSATKRYRHITTVSVKLHQATNTQRKPNQDAYFAAAQVKHLKNLACILGQKNGTVGRMVKTDDKWHQNIS
ncbi:unnamed protein product, partial [Allacma fusca]